MMREAPIELHIGQKGSGKTFFGMKSIESAKHSLIVDLNAQPILRKNAVLIPDLNSLIHAAENFDRRKKVRYVWAGEGRMSPVETFSAAASFCLVVGGVWLFADEMDSMIPKAESEIEPHVRRIIRQGRHSGGPDASNPLGVPLIGTALVRTQVSPLFRNQCDLVSHPYYGDETQNDYLRKTFGTELFRALEQAPKYSRLVMEGREKRLVLPDNVKK